MLFHYTVNAKSIAFSVLAEDIIEFRYSRHFKDSNFIDALEMILIMVSVLYLLPWRDLRT